MSQRSNHLSNLSGLTARVAPALATTARSVCPSGIDEGSEEQLHQLLAELVVDELRVPLQEHGPPVLHVLRLEALDHTVGCTGIEPEPVWDLMDAAIVHRHDLPV